MNQFEKVNSSDQLRDPQAALMPDARSDFTVAFRPDGSVSKMTLVDRHQTIAEYVLVDSVPQAIRVHFETAKNLYLYAWFVYRFYPVAEKQALASLEFALRERLTVFLLEKHGAEVKIPKGLSKLFAKAVAENLLTNEGLRANERLARKRASYRASMERIQEMQALGLNQMEYEETAIEPLPEDYAHNSLKIFGETLPQIRNDYAHGSSMLHASVLSTFEIVTDLVNQLFVQQDK
jgi:hypothetical protein